jgi:alpha/beta superfamily hydrolase
MQHKPPRSESIVIPGPSGAIQALVETPDGQDARHFAVVCHPHPLYGGTLDNKVVYTLARAFEELGAPAIRFNFRGVGASQGKYDEGVGETDDALAVISYGRQRWPDAALWLAGFSFGGAVAIQAAARVQPQRLVAVAPAVMRLDRLDVRVSESRAFRERVESAVGDFRQSDNGVLTRSSPWLIVQGDADEVLDAAAVLEWASKVAPPPAVKILSGASHFFHGRLHELRTAVLDFMRNADA